MDDPVFDAASRRAQKVFETVMAQYQRGSLLNRLKWWLDPSWRQIAVIDARNQMDIAMRWGLRARHRITRGECLGDM